MASPRAFLRRVVLQPGESLPSLLVRLMEANFCEPDTLFTQFCAQYLADLGIRDTLEQPRHPATYDLLAALTDVAPRQLAEATVHHFAPDLNLCAEPLQVHLADGQSLELADQTTRDNLRSTDNTQYCPICLQEAAYHRLAWSLRTISVCLRHECLLTDVCWRCGRWVSIKALVRRQCEDCSADLTAFKPWSVPPSVFGFSVQEALQAWLGLHPLNHPLSQGLPDKPPRILFKLVYGLQASLRTRWGWKYFYWSSELPAEADPSRYHPKRPA